jgi:hypothetical protein
VTELVLGAGRIDRLIPAAESLLRGYKRDIGYEYLRYQPNTPIDRLLPEDLAITLLVNSRATYRAFQSLRMHGSSVDLHKLPDGPLETSSDIDVRIVAKVIAEIASWPGFAASLATKVLHKKRPDLIPILDNQAIFGAYMNPKWPTQVSSQDSVKAMGLIEQALRWIRHDLIRHENTHAWTALHELEPSNSRNEIFDSIWWMYFRNVEPVRRLAPSRAA